MNRFAEYLEKVKQDDAGKYDVNTPINRVRMNEGRLQGITNQQGHTTFHLTDWAMNQLCFKLGVPKKYMEKCPPALRDENINHWLSQPDLKDEVKLRCKNNLVRGIVSDKYVPLDNGSVLGIANDLLDGKDIDIKNFDLSEQSFNMRLTFPRLTKDVSKSKVGDIVQCGVHIRNSEVGSSSVHVYALVFRLRCTNGLVSAGGDDEILNQRHIGIRMNELRSRFGESIGKASKVGADMMERFIASQEIPVNDPMKAIEDLAKERFSDKFTDEIKSAFAVEPESSRYGIVNAITRASQTLKNMDDRVEVEQFASKYLASRVA